MKTVSEKIQQQVGGQVMRHIKIQIYHQVWLQTKIQVDYQVWHQVCRLMLVENRATLISLIRHNPSDGLDSISSLIIQQLRTSP